MAIHDTQSVCHELQENKEVSFADLGKVGGGSEPGLSWAPASPWETKFLHQESAPNSRPAWPPSGVVDAAQSQEPVPPGPRLSTDV